MRITANGDARQAMDPVNREALTAMVKDLEAGKVIAQQGPRLGATFGGRRILQ